MNRYVVDTHALLWYLSRSKRLSRKARSIFLRAHDGHEQVIVPSIVLIEAVFLMQRERIEGHITQILLDLPEDPQAGIYVYPLNLAIARVVKDFGPEAIPEMPDRIIAATARHLDLPLLTADTTIHNSKMVYAVW